MKIIKFTALFIFIFLLSNCQKEIATPPELIGFKIKSITIDNLPTGKETHLGDNKWETFDCWDELDCDNEQGYPDVYLKLEQEGSPHFSQLDFFTSEVFENYSNEQAINIAVPDRVFVTGFLYKFFIFDKDELNDERISTIWFPHMYTLRPDNDVFPTTLVDSQNDITIEIEYVYQ